MGEQLTLFTGVSPANNDPSPWRVTKKDRTTTDISGLNFRAWSPKLDRFGSLLRMYLESCELPLTTLERTWSVSATASGFGILKLRLSERRTGECGCSLWRTPKASDPNHGSASHEGILRRLEKSQTIRLQDQVNHPELFPTPRAAEGMTHPLRANVVNPRGRLEDYVALFPTPTVHGDYNRKGASKNSGDGLATFVKLYPTPTANDAKNNAAPSQYTENGRNANALNVVAGGALNPEWVEWLMGFPPGWTDLSGEESQISPEQPEESRIACTG
jgi:hypothetical protein